MARPTIERAGLDEYIRLNYDKEKKSDIAKKFFVDVNLLRRRAKSLGLTRTVKSSERDCSGIPPGFGDADFIKETVTGSLFQRGNVTRHSIKA